MRLKFLILATSLLFGLEGFTQEIGPFKDQLFEHGRTLERQGNYRLIDYNEQTDVNGRDEIPVDKAHDNRVYLLGEYEQSRRLNRLQVHQIGSLDSSNFVVIFIHGAGGNRDLGFNDWSFGGNFNRLKNLAVRNGGAYISPSVSFNQNSFNRVGEMITTLKSRNPTIKVILSCASQGGSLCWSLAQNNSYSNQIAGMVFLGSAVNMPSVSIPFISQGKPIVFAHGTRDPILPWQNLMNSYQRILNSNRNYPVRYYLFNGGIHGTPVRMVDWRLVLNWIL